MEAAGKLEEAYLASAVPSGLKLDLPPAYDEVANLHVAVPVVVLANNSKEEEGEQAAPLPEKEKIQEEV